MIRVSLDSYRWKMIEQRSPSGNRVGETVSGDELFLFIVHVVTDRISQLHRDIKAAFGTRGPVVAVRYVKDKGASDPLEINGEPVLTLDRQDLLSLGYPEKCRRERFQFIPGNPDLIDLFLAREFGSPSFVWRMECDVAYTGEIEELLGTLGREEADLICTRGRPAKYGWQHHRLTLIPEGWPASGPDELVVFLPFARISGRLLSALDRFYKDGGRGHFEWTWAYVTRAMDYSILDVGGTGPYTPPHYRNRYYPAQTALRRPTFDHRYVMHAAGTRPNTLWHPVKDWDPRRSRPLSESLPGHFLRYTLHENPALRRWLSSLGLVK